MSPFRADEVSSTQRDADYAYRPAVDPPPAKELRLFGLVEWTIDRFVNRRIRLHALQYEATPEQGRVIELGTHDELIAKGGRYRTMFDLQAQRFIAEDEEGMTYDVLS